MGTYDTSGLEAELAKANLNPLAGRARTPEPPYAPSGGHLEPEAHGSRPAYAYKPKAAMRDVGADLKSELAKMRKNMAKSRVQAETSIWGAPDEAAGAVGGPMDSFLDSSVRAADMEQARIAGGLDGLTPLERATAKYREQLGKMKTRFAKGGESSRLAIGGPPEKLLLTGGWDQAGSMSDEEEEEEECLAAVRESLGSRWNKWGPSKGAGSRKLRESWEDLHNGPMSSKERAEHGVRHVPSTFENLSEGAKRLSRHLQEGEDGSPEALRLNAALHSWRQLSEVAELCRAAPSLLEIGLTDNNLGDEAASAVARVLRSAAPGLVAVDLSNNVLKTKAMQVISPEFGTGSGIQQLLLGGNPLGDRTLHILSNSLHGGKALLHLDLSRADLTFAAAEPLGELLAATPSLRILDLSWNRLGSRGGRALARALTSVAQDHSRQGLGLASLRLQHTGLGDDGAAHVALSLLHCRTLEELDLGSTKAGLATCKALAYVLDQSRGGPAAGLLRLGLTDNPLGCNGAAVLLRAVAQPGCQLEELLLEQASFVDVGVQETLKAPQSATKSPSGSGAAVLRRAVSSKEEATPAAKPSLSSAGRRRPMSAMSPGLKATAAAGPGTAAAAIREAELEPGSFKLHLEEAASRLCMLQLLDAAEGETATIRRMKLDGRKVPYEGGWAAWRTQMPDEGTVELEMTRIQEDEIELAPEKIEHHFAPVAPQLKGPVAVKAAPGVLAIRQELIENMCGMLEAVGPLDAWRLQLVRMMCCAGLQATAQQALQLTMAFGESMGRERGQAAGLLVENVGLDQASMLLGTLEEILLPAEVEEAQAGMERLLSAARRAAEDLFSSTESEEESSEDEPDDEEEIVERKPPPAAPRPGARGPVGFGVRERMMTDGRAPARESKAKGPAPKRTGSGHEAGGKRSLALSGKPQRRSSLCATTNKPGAPGTGNKGASKISTRRSSNPGSGGAHVEAPRVRVFAGVLDSQSATSSPKSSAARDMHSMDRYHESAGYSDPYYRAEYIPQASALSPDVSMQAAEFSAAKHQQYPVVPSAFHGRYEE